MATYTHHGLPGSPATSWSDVYTPWVGPFGTLNGAVGGLFIDNTDNTKTLLTGLFIFDNGQMLSGTVTSVERRAADNTTVLESVTNCSLDSVALFTAPTSIAFFQLLLSGNDGMFGHDGADTIAGEAGNDNVDGGLGNDKMYGGEGDDHYQVDSAGDAVIEQANEGNDTVHSTLLNYTLPDHVENLLFHVSTGPTGYGNGLDNLIKSSSSKATLHGLGGNDVLAAFGNDKLYGGEGNDNLHSSGGDNLLVGGAGNDTYHLHTQIFSTIKEVAGEGTKDKVKTGLSTYTLPNEIEVLQYVGTEAFTGTGNELDNVIYGGANADTLYGLDGNDTMVGLGSFDVMFGGKGDDLYYMLSVTDYIAEAANEGYDTVVTNCHGYLLAENVEAGEWFGGTPGYLVGNKLNNALSGRGLADSLRGNGGNDLLLGGAGADELDGGSGLDTASYQGAAKGVTVNLATGANSDGDVLSSIENLIGSGKNDKLTGDTNANVVEGGDGGDVLAGGSGLDTLSYASSDAGVVASLANGVAYGGHADGDTISGFENITGSAHVDYLVGNAVGNILSGAGGGDILKGEGGDDTIDGGAGNDDMSGGSGDDTFYVDSAGDQIKEAANGGSDTVITKTSYALAAGSEVELLRAYVTKKIAIDLTGNELAQTLQGNAAANKLDGGAGVDTLIGMAGNDTYYVDNVGSDDKVVEAADAGIDTVRSTTTYVLTAGASVEGLQTTDNAGTTSMTLVGNDLAQTISGNAGINVLRGLAGSDQLIGGNGNDTLTGHAGADKFLFNTALNAATNVDTITDMAVAADIIRLDDAIFTQAGAVGALNADAFHIGAAAADAEDRIVYNSVTGDLFYDSNGTGAGGSTLFAHLTAGLALSNTDFNVV